MHDSKTSCPLTVAQDAAFKRVIGKGLPEAMHVKVMQGRTLYVPSASYGVARFDFHDLCGRPLGAADYLALTENFHTGQISDRSWRC